MSNAQWRSRLDELSSPLVAERKSTSLFVQAEAAGDTDGAPKTEKPGTV